MLTKDFATAPGLKIDDVTIDVEPGKKHFGALHNFTWQHTIMLTAEGENGTCEIEFTSPLQLDNLINELIQRRNQVWPWPRFEAAE